MLNILTRSKPAPARAPNARPKYAAPGRLVIIDKSLAAADEMIRLWEKEGRWATSEQEQADVRRTISLLKAKEEGLLVEKDLTVEAAVPPWYADQHARVMADIGTEIAIDTDSALIAVHQFLGRDNRTRDLRQGGGYALQLIDVPLTVWARRMGGR